MAAVRTRLMEREAAALVRSCGRWASPDQRRRRSSTGLWDSPELEEEKP